MQICSPLHVDAPHAKDSFESFPVSSANPSVPPSSSGSIVTPPHATLIAATTKEPKSRFMRRL
jgi:hypothetical protein